MGDYTQIGSIVPDNLEDDAKREWLERLEDSMNVRFVEVTDGDASAVYDFDNSQVLALQELLEDEYASGCYVAVDKGLASDHDIGLLDSVRERSTAKPWSGCIYYAPAQ